MQIVKCNGWSSFYLALFNQTQHNICTMTQTNIWQISIYSTIWFCMKEIPFRWGGAPKFRPKPNGISSNKLVCALLSIVRNHAFINAVSDKLTILFETEIQLFSFFKVARKTKSSENIALNASIGDLITSFHSSGTVFASNSFKVGCKSAPFLKLLAADFLDFLFGGWVSCTDFCFLFLISFVKQIRVTWWI